MTKLSKTTTTALFNSLARASKGLAVPYRLALTLLVIALIIGITYLVPESDSSPNSPSSNQSMPDGAYAVAKVVDGDTFKVMMNNQEQTIRLIGIDTPEVVDPRRPVQCFGREASNHLKSLINQESVRLEADPSQADVDQYGRKLRYAYLLDGTNLNLSMIAQGYAHEYTFRVPYVQQQKFKLAEQQARTTQQGLWNSRNCPQ